MAHLRKIAIVLLAVAGWLWPARAEAQFIGYTSAQSTTSTPFNAAVCSVAQGTIVNVTNIGQGAHWATAVAGSSLTELQYAIEGSYDGVNYFDISDFGTLPTAGGATDISNVTGTGYYPVVAVKLIACLPASGTVTIRYSGISLPPGAPAGSAQNGQVNKHLASLLSGNGTAQFGVLRAPFGTSAGTLNFLWTGTGSTGATLVVSCITTLGNNASQVFTFPLQTTNGLGQNFNVPPAACPYFNVNYNNGGATTANFTLDYAFTPPGSLPPPYAYSHIVGITATAIKATAGTVHTLSINLGAAGTVSLFDLGTAACTGTPATNQVAIITATATTLQTFTYDANFLNGICLKASVAMDLTVSYQ